jgi:translation initiation factor 3 subunit E
LIHWSLYVYFHHPKGRELLIDLFFTHGHESYLNTVQTTCPHILRYITAAAIISKRRKNIMKELVKIIQQVCLFLNIFLNIQSKQFIPLLKGIL